MRQFLSKASVAIPVYVPEPEPAGAEFGTVAWHGAFLVDSFEKFLAGHFFPLLFFTGFGFVAFLTCFGCSENMLSHFS